MSKETKCNCQYEEGHSFECPLYRPTPNPLEEPKESFEERTAKKLDNDILDKISNKAKQETIAKVREMIEKMYKEEDTFGDRIYDGFTLTSLSDEIKGII